MSERVWAKITSGARFEALVSTLLFFEDPDTILFGRPGVDGGQDARSGDGKRVFQAKHHQKASAAKAIADAKSEAEKIAKYRTPGHERYEQWKLITEWRLVANATFNSTDQQRWDEEVVPLFDKLKLKADYWEQADLDALLAKHPEVDRAFFGGETRVFLTVAEARERFVFHEPFLERAASGGFYGREDGLDDFSEFIGSSNLAWVLHGAGGVGKTRLLLEAGASLASTGEWQVLWANTASMEASNNWFNAVVPERKTLLLVDEPDSEGLLKVLVEQLGPRLGRTGTWKLAVCVRSPKDPVLNYLRNPRLKSRITEFALSPLANDEGRQLCEELIEGGPLAGLDENRRLQAVDELSKRFAQFPVWLGLAVSVLENKGNLSDVPDTAEALADLYLGEVVYQAGRSAPDVIEELLRWVSMIGTVNREDEGTVSVLATRTRFDDRTEMLAEINRLVRRRVLVERGARNRLVELKPDVMRDHVLRRWLSVEHGGEPRFVPSQEGRALAKTLADSLVKGRLSSVGAQILRSLVRTELLFNSAGTSVQLTGPIFEVLEAELSQMGPSARIALLERFQDLAFANPAEVLRLCRRIRNESVDSETVEGLLGNRELGQDDVVLDCAWAVFHAAMRAREEATQEMALQELIELGSMERKIAPSRQYGLPNDGKRAEALVSRVLQGGPNFLSDFAEVGRRLALAAFDGLGTRAPDEHSLPVLTELLKEMTAVERTVSWSEDRSFHWTNYVISPDGNTWAARETLLQRLRALVEGDDVPDGSRIFAWKILAEAHSSANRGLKSAGDPASETIRAHLLENLRWAANVLRTRTVELPELREARSLWDWHARFEKDPDLSAAAQDLESLFRKNETVAEFGTVSDLHRPEHRQAWAEEKANALLGATSPTTIAEFVGRAWDYLGSGNLFVANVVAGKLGEAAKESAVVASFVRDELARGGGVERGVFQFALVAAASWVSTLRKSSSDRAIELIKELIELCPSSEERSALIVKIYDGYARYELDKLPETEFDLLLAAGSEMARAGWGPQFLRSAAWWFRNDWTSLKQVLEQVFAEIAEEQKGVAGRALVSAIYSSLSHGRSTAASQPPKELGVWLLQRIASIRDLDSLAHSQWELEELLKVLERPSPSLMVDVLRQRAQMEEEQGYERSKAIGIGDRFTRFVRPFASEGATAGDDLVAANVLLDMASNQGTVGYRFPEICQDFDPEGRVLPQLVSERIEGTQDYDDVWRLSRIAGGYSPSSASWRTIAHTTIGFARTREDREKHSLFSALTDHRPQSWSGQIGEVPSVFISERDTAKRRLAEESDPLLREFWQWQLDAAEAALEHQVQQAKEDRGE